MAIKWTTNVKIKQLSGGIVDVTVTRLDDETGDSWSHTIDNVDSNTTTIKQAANCVWKLWLKNITQQAEIKAKKDSIEAALSAALMEKEI